MTIRDRIKAIQKEVRDTDIQIDRAAELLMQASALLGNVNDEIREADIAYNVVLLAHLQSSEKANHAKIEAECSDEYRRKREARDTRDVLIEMIRSLKYLLRAKEDERRYSGHQA